MAIAARPRVAVTAAHIHFVSLPRVVPISVQILGHRRGLVMVQHRHWADHRISGRGGAHRGRKNHVSPSWRSFQSVDLLLHSFKLFFEGGHFELHVFIIGAPYSRGAANLFWDFLHRINASRLENVLFLLEFFQM